jgi:hypothetical protein
MPAYQPSKLSRHPTASPPKNAEIFRTRAVSMMVALQYLKIPAVAGAAEPRTGPHPAFL